jgi:cyclopropane fatty-acyl-phospholipid synthase-like methyltransferase
MRHASNGKDKHDQGLEQVPCGAHYQAVSQTYHSAFFYSGEFQAWKYAHIQSRLHLRPNHKLVDIGGGTGHTARWLYHAAVLTQPVVCVDPSAAMIAKATTTPGVKAVRAGGLEFVRATTGFDRVLLCEVIHHFSHADLATLFDNLLTKLSPGGLVLVCTRPRVVQYPFFDAALRIWEKQQPPSTYYADGLRCAGFERVTEEVLAYSVTIERESWLGMVRNRFWSTLSRRHFTDPELEAGIKEITTKYFSNGERTVSFTEKLVFLTAHKPAVRLPSLATKRKEVQSHAEPVWAHMKNTHTKP